MLALGVVVLELLPLAQASAADPQSSPPPDDLAAGAARGVVGLLLVPDAQASALAPQSSFVAPLPSADLAVVFAAVLLEVTDPQALVAAFQSSGSLLAGAAERDVEVLEALEVLPTPQSSTGASHDSVGAPLDEPESRRNLKMLKFKKISRF